MDPLSITTGILALLGACSTASRAITKIRGIRQAPALIHAVNNELSDLQLALMEFKDYLRRKEEVEPQFSITNAATYERCSSVLSQARDKVEELEMLMQYRILKAGREETFDINRIAFLKEQSRLIRLQGDLRNAKQQIAMLSTQLGLQDASGIQALVTGLSLTSHQTREKMQDGFSTLIQGQENIQRTLDQILQLQSAPSSTNTSLIAGTHASPAAKGGVQISVARRSRPYSAARCLCHLHLGLEWMEPFFGRLFMGYAVSPVPENHRNGCAYGVAAEFTVVYTFPFWVWNAIIAFSTRYNGLEGLTCSLSFRSTLPGDHIIWDYIGASDINGMHALISSGQVSINSQNASGSTFLHQSILMGRPESVQYLLEMGADPFAKVATRLTPQALAWNYILSRTYAPEVRVKWRSLFPRPDFNELYGFNAAHKAVLQLEGSSLSSALDDVYDVVNAVDFNGRTALSWACGRADAQAVRILLSHGAMTDILDNRKRSPLSYASTKSRECVDLLIQANVNPNSGDIGSTTSLMFASQSTVAGTDLLEIMESLLKAGSDINSQNESGYTALICSLSQNNQDVSEYLLEHGADPGLLDLYGNNALCWATRQNCHHVLPFLLRKQQDHTGTLDQWGTFMHLAAQFADADTLRMLAQGRLKPRDINVKNKAGLSPLNLGLQREEVDPEWREAFVDFLKSIDQEQPRSRKASKWDNVPEESFEATFDRPMSDDSEEDAFEDAEEGQN